MTETPCHWVATPQLSLFAANIIHYLLSTKKTILFLDRSKNILDTNHYFNNYPF